MNNIHEKDWAEDNWGGHSGMDNHADYATVDKDPEDKPAATNGDDLGLANVFRLS